MKKVQKIIALLTTGVLFAGMLAGCGKPDPDPNSGVYEAVSATMMGMEIDVTDVYENGVSFDLQDGGKCIANMDGETAKIKWSTDGDSIHIEGGGVELDGTIGGGDMTLVNMMDMGMDMTFHCDELLHSGLDSEEASDKDKDSGKDKKSDKEKSSDKSTSGGVLERLRDAKNGKNVYGQSASGTSSSDDIDLSEWGMDIDDWDIDWGDEESDAGSGDVSEIAAAKGLDASWFGPGTCDPDPLAEFYHYWSDELSWDEKEEISGDFYDMIVEKAGCKPLDDNTEEYMDRAEFKYVTPGGGVLGFYLDKTDDGGWEYGGMSCTGDVLDAYHELEE